jgi:CubicO group peptidase (beta-lactamase class C family)
MVVEAVTGRDFREVLRERVIAPCGLDREIVVGLGDTDLDRAADMHAVDAGGFVADEQEYEPATKKAGRPGGGGYATARGLAAFYQALLAGGVLPGRGRIASRAMLAYALRDWTPGLPDGDGNPASRGLGVMMRGPAERPSAMGAVASPSTFGHGGLGSSQCWADPTTGLSFAYITNARQDDPWHSRRMDIVSSMAHAAVL